MFFMLPALGALMGGAATAVGTAATGLAAAGTAAATAGGLTATEAALIGAGAGMLLGGKKAPEEAPRGKQPRQPRVVGFRKLPDGREVPIIEE